MNTATTTPVIDYTRIQKEIFMQQQKVARMQQFLMQRSLKLEAAAHAIEKFMEHNRLVLPKYTNAHSTGWGSNEYSDDSDMLIECLAVCTEGIKNIALYTKRFTTKWDEQMKHTTGISLDRVIIAGGKATLHLRVRP